MITILRSQAKTKAGYVSTAVGYLNSVWYQFRQFTHTFTVVSEPVAGTLRLLMPSTTGIVVGSKIRAAGNIYDGVAVGTVSAVAANVSIDVTGMIFRGTDAGFIVDLSFYKNLNVETELFDPITTYAISKATSSWATSPNLTGIIDVQSEVRSLFYSQREIPVLFSAPYLNKHISSGLFRLRYREVYINSSNVIVAGAWIPIAEDVISVSARKQIQEPFGNNLVDLSIKVPVGRFLTRFARPFKYVSTPRPVSFLFDGKVSFGNNFRVTQEAFDAAGASLGVTRTQDGNISAGLSAAGIYDFMMGDTAGAAYYKMSVTSPSLVVPLAEDLFLDVKERCAQSILVEWENSLGGFDQWMFLRKFDVALEPGYVPEATERYDPDIEISKGNLYRDGVDTRMTLTVFDDYVKTSDVYPFDEMKKSKNVKIIFASATIFVSVVLSVTTGSLRNKYSQVSVTFRLPRNFNPSLVDPAL